MPSREIFGQVLLRSQPAPAVSPAGQAAIYYDSATDTVKISVNGGAFVTFSTGNTAVTAAAALTANQLLIGGGSGAVSTLGSLGTTTTLLHGNAGGAPTFAAVSLTADVSGVLPPANGAVVNLSATGFSYLWTPIVRPNTTATANIFGGADEVVVEQIIVPYRVKISKVNYHVQTSGGAGSKIGFGLYDSNGVKLTATAALDYTVTGVSTANVDTTVTLDAGIYYVASTSDSTSGAVTITANGTNVLGILTKNSAHNGTAANAGAAGVLPATLGVIGNNNRSQPLLLWEF